MNFKERLGKTLKKIVFLHNFNYLFLKLGKQVPPANRPRPLIFGGAMVLATKETNRIFFFLFLFKVNCF